MICSDARTFLWAVLPFVLSLTLYVAGFFLFAARVDDLAASIVARGAWWRDALNWLVTVGLWVAVPLLIVFTYVFVSFVVAGPLYEYLSLSVERRVLGRVEQEPFSLPSVLGDLWRGVSSAAILLGLQLLVLAGSFTCVPVSTVICFGLSAMLLGLEHLDYPLVRRRLGFRQRVDYVRQRFWTVFGFGVTTLAGLLIPLGGALFLPMGVAGATLLFCHQNPPARARESGP